MVSGIFLVCFYVLFFIGKLVYDWTTPSYKVSEELVEKDNVAVAVAMVGYYFGLVLSIGGVMTGTSYGLEENLIDVMIFGPLSILGYIPTEVHNVSQELYQPYVLLALDRI